MASETGVRCDTRSLEVANFSDHDDVRRLAKDGTQRGRKRHADLGIHLHLIDPGHLIFDRFFDGNDFAVRFVDVIEAGVKRGRFSGSRRAGYKENPIRQSDQTFERFLVVGEKSKLGQTKLQVRLIEDTQNHALTVIARHGRDAKVDGLFFDPHLDATILRQAFLGDTDRAGHDLEPADNG